MKSKFQISTETILNLGLFFLATLITLGIYSCNKSNKMADSQEVATEQNDEKFSEKKQNDADFLVEAAIINMEEIEFGKLAQSISKTDQVIALGKMMEAEHSESYKALQELAEKKHMVLPTTLNDKGIAQQKKLLNMVGAEFDKTYCDLMVKGHKEAIEKFAKEASSSSDSEISSWASSTLPHLRNHLNSAIAAKTVCDNVQPPIIK